MFISKIDNNTYLFMEDYMNIDLVLNIIRNVIDICLVWFGLYYILKNIRNNVKMTLLFKGILLIIIFTKK